MHPGIGTEEALRSLDLVLRSDVEPSRVAAIVIEPVRGEGGFDVAPPELLRALRRIGDEILSRLGRTGRMIAIEHADVEPELVTIAKSLAGGFPLFAVTGRAAVMDAVEPGGSGERAVVRRSAVRQRSPYWM